MTDTTAARVEKGVFYGAIFLILGGLLALIFFVIAASAKNYTRGIAMAEKVEDKMSANPGLGYRPDVALLYSVQNSRGQDAAVVKYGAVYLGYMIVVLGAAFVLNGGKVFYRLRHEGKEVKSSLETSSPGLVMITLGSLLVVVAIFTKSTLDTQVDWGVVAKAVPSPPSASPSPAPPTHEKPIHLLEGIEKP